MILTLKQTFDEIFASVDLEPKDLETMRLIFMTGAQTAAAIQDDGDFVLIAAMRGELERFLTDYVKPFISEYEATAADARAKTYDPDPAGGLPFMRPNPRRLDGD